MKSISINGSAPNSLGPLPSREAPAPGSAGYSFEKVLERVRSGLEGVLGAGIGSTTGILKTAAQKGFKLSPEELIVYQIRAGEFGLRVELLSKMAESAMSTVRKFQNPG